jgi:uncharacterized protein DUF5615
MMPRFQADVHLNELILRAACRREPALVFHTAAAASLGGLPDPEVLERAAEEGCILVTHDIQIMPRHFAAFITTHQSAGRRLVPQRLSIAAVADDLLLIWSTMEAEEWIDLLWYLPL